ncbi:LppX_LprAFG lipoprotein [Blastococcus brunescens]|uniref:LppX_LprAFG lipoprotein n=1 Tax=Blastococcus brunescens TaxID=1564165 RepID=A0ABZ1B6Q2_9ACTN|nr:LppX_LprAFG lipoprotein [Blastococcus sp. BMG 8361]WRL65528.1 LppX_LprAFG lipoprotein [Blastococcus sp. BMG 8361]
MRRTAAPLLALALLAVPALSGCGGDDAGDTESAADLLAQAKQTLDEADSAHFVLTSEGAPETGTALVGGEGDIARPAAFEGTLQVLAMGSTLDLAVVSVDGTVYAQLPFTSGFSEVDPAQFGFGDPGELIDADTGISQLLSSAESAELGRSAGWTARWSAR